MEHPHVGGKVRVDLRHLDAAVHEFIAVEGFACKAQALAARTVMRQSLSRVVSGDIILCGRIECLELQRAQFCCRRRERLEVEEHDLLTVSRYKLPSRLVALAATA